MDFVKRYPSGLRVVGKRMDSFHTVSLGVFVDVGCVRENRENNGYSHFIEHLVFKGTQRRTCLQISEAIDDIGANINAFTTKDCTCFYTKGAAADLETCMDVLSDLYFNATVPQQELEREKGVVLEEIKMCEDDPEDVCQDLASQALFYEQKLGKTILGKPKIINYSDRHSILKFKKEHYIPSATVISVCGMFDFDQLDKLVEKYFEQYTEKNAGALSDEPEVGYRSRFLHKFKHIEQAHLQLAWGGVSLKSGERQACNVLASILGGGLSSRLNQVIREQNGLAYSVYAYPSYYVNCGTFEIYIGLSPENNRLACRLLAGELRLLVEEGISERELQRAKVSAVNSLYMNAESNLTLMRLCGRNMLKLDRPFDLEADVACYNSLTCSDVNELARRIFSRQHASAYVGPQIPDFDAVSMLSEL